MNQIHPRLKRAAGTDLERIIEPLANYICATEQPERVLLSVLAVLRHEVKMTNRTALSHFRGYSEN
jgi:hypothetical protein